jgi:alpha-tubulin suppressor-like RCC1 family protein
VLPCQILLTFFIVEGNLYCVGSNEQGECGIHDKTSTYEPTLVNVPHVEGKIVKAIAANYDASEYELTSHSIILTGRIFHNDGCYYLLTIYFYLLDSGNVYTFGNNFRGQLCHTNNFGTTNPNPGIIKNRTKFSYNI